LEHSDTKHLWLCGRGTMDEWDLMNEWWLAVGCWWPLVSGQVRRENGVDVGFETPLSSRHIGIGTKLCCIFEISVTHYFLYQIELKSTVWWCTTKINNMKTKWAFSVWKENLFNIFSFFTPYIGHGRLRSCCQKIYLSKFRIRLNSFPVMVSNMRPLPTPLSCVWPYLGQFLEWNQS
jgi:hypothetical protein